MSFNPATDMPSMAGKIIFITGGTTGIGKSAIRALAVQSPAHVYFTGRNEAAGAECLTDFEKLAPKTKFTFIRSDLASTRDQIRSDVLKGFKSDRLDLFIANAGIMAVPPATTAEGLETQFGTNFFGHAILLRLLLPVLLRTAASNSQESDVRLVVLSSFGHTMHPEGGIQFDELRNPEAGTKWSRYGQSKLADILLAKAMAKRHPEITSISIHPGLVNTELSRNSEPSLLSRIFSVLRYTPLMKSSDVGAHNTLWAATTAKENLINGAYYAPVGKVPGKASSYSDSGMAEICNDESLADRLWEWTEKELGDLKL